MITSRRSFIGGLAALITAPAIVRAGSLMPVKVMQLEMDAKNYVIPPSSVGSMWIRVDGGDWTQVFLRSTPSGKLVSDSLPLSWSGHIPQVEFTDSLGVEYTMNEKARR